MTTREEMQKYLEDTVRTVVVLYDLSGWHITCAFGDADQDADLRRANAYTNVNYCHRNARMVLDQDADPTYYYYLVLHELAHLVLMDVHEAASTLPKASRKIILRLMHQAVDTFARAVLGYYPDHGKITLDKAPWE